MDLTFHHNGKCGDILYSLPTIEEMGGGILYIPERTVESEHIYSNLRELLLQQPCIKELREYPSDLGYQELVKDIKIDIDLDRHKTHKRRGTVNMVQRYFETFHISKKWNTPWLTVKGENIMKEPYTLVHVTPRFRDNSKVNWAEVIESIEGKVYFIGYGFEWLEFTIKNAAIEHINTATIMDMARLIKHCKALYCNQSVSLVIAQGLGKEYYLELKPTKTNCLMYTPNEHIL